MNATELAAQLNGMQYPVRISKEISKAAKDAGLVIVYGASDDLVEFEGAIRDELGAYNGTTAHLDSTGLLQNDCDNEECPHFEKLKAMAATIKAVWDNGTGYSWTYETTIPHATFEVLEEGAPPYCRGIVFALSAVLIK